MNDGGIPYKVKPSLDYQPLGEKKVREKRAIMKF